MRFVMIDLVPALLEWEGRDPFDLAEARDGALELVDDLYEDFGLAAVTDGDRPASVVRDAMEQLGLAPYFDSIGTSAVFGPLVTPRVIRRIAVAIGGVGHSIVVTGRPDLAEAMRLSGIPTIPTGDDLSPVAGEVRRMAFGRVNP